METAAALIAAMAADTVDDLPRLAYADWLDEHGQPERAEFIRLMCRDDNTSRSRAAALLAAHGQAWDAPLAPWGAKKQLNLSGGSNTPNRIGEEGARRLAATCNFLQLSYLRLMYNHICDTGFTALVQSPNLP